MGNTILSKFSRHKADEDQYRFWSAVASSLRLGWLGDEDKDRGADVCLPDSRGRTALHLAASEADVQTVKFLLGKGSEINARDNAGGTPILDAIRCKNVEVVTYLLSEGAVLDMSEVELGTEMCCLAYLGDVEQMEAWRVAGVSLNFADVDGRTPLHVLRDKFNNRPVDDAQRLSLVHFVKLLSAKAKKPHRKAVLAQDNSD
ncbi:hypothetical protein ACEWY4_009728 [Coilia grayii]|uniref:Uncharacterized protein n=1 Tax=Coilia grayii TaxID=363190 RepID=A0ABD1K780_9TELE